MTAPVELVIVGCGGHGRELLDVIRAINDRTPTWDVVGFVDDDPHHLDRLTRLGLKVLGDTEWLIDHPHSYALGIGTSSARESLVDRFDAAGLRPATVVHPGATIGADTVLGEGVVVYQSSVITTNVAIGRHTHLNVACAVQHDTRLGDFVQLSPGVLVNGDCEIADRAFLGTGAIVTRGCRVGPDARVGAGAVVLDHVEAAATVVGAPARRRLETS
jgi:sugar O-acyltransferase (sialic acid O-acetyltransferase NeuD family)